MNVHKKTGMESTREKEEAGRERLELIAFELLLLLQLGDSANECKER
jgi:hypothetical protein